MACCKKGKKLRAKRLKEAAEMRNLVKNPDWQLIRKRLVGTWIKQPEWACDQLKQYLGSYSSATDEQLRIVMNYLTGTGFRTGKIKHSCIQTLRSQISMERKKRKAMGIKK